jgi:hypothetical protein
MLRRLAWLSVLSAALLPAAASAQSTDFPGLDAGTWEFTLTGTGANTKDFDSGSAGVQVSLGYFIFDQFEIQGRQTVNYSDTDNVGGGTSITATSAVAIDYHFDLDRFQPFIGGAIGYSYGKDTNDTGFAGPEAGIKYFVKDDTFIYGLAQYEFFFNSGDDIDDAFDDGAFVYAIGIGFTW